MTSPSNPELLETLSNAGVLAEGPDGGFDLTESFRGRAETYRQEVTELDSDERAVRVATAWPDDEPPVDAVRTLPPSSLGTLLAVLDSLTDVNERIAARVLVTVEHLDAGPVPDDGAPEAFLPVTVAELRTIVPLYDPCIVYVWRRDCDPCDLMRETFDELLREPPEDLLPVAVYGPDDAQLLSERFDVVGGPTSLFVSDGRVASRLIGAHHESVVESEIEAIVT